MYKKSMSLFLLSAICCSTAWAAGSMKPGLWEMTSKSDVGASMPQISPQQMEKMRRMGINMAPMQNGPRTMKMCITKEMAERDKAPPMGRQNDSECQSRNFQQSGSNYSVDIVCEGPHMKGEGKGHGTFSSGESFTSTYDFKGTAGGRPVTQHHETTGKWLGADCGDVKPMGNYMGRKMQ